MRITSCGITDVGERRAHNEDNFLVNDELQLFVVCDGMGGHAGGEIASAIAVHTLEEAFSSIDWEQRIKSSEEDVEEIAEQLICSSARRKRTWCPKGTQISGWVPLVSLHLSTRLCLSLMGSRGYLIRGARLNNLPKIIHWSMNASVQAVDPEEANHKLKMSSLIGIF